MVSFHVNTYNTDSIDIDKMVNGFLPNLIHSIDGSVMRLISEKVMKGKGYTINHLHDSIQCHPNEIELVYNCITEVYTGNFFIKFLDENVFTPMKNKLLLEDHAMFDTLVLDFKKEFKIIKIDEKYFSPRDMYPFE